jgi:hypothetical protein
MAARENVGSSRGMIWEDLEEAIFVLEKPCGVLLVF